MKKSLKTKKKIESTVFYGFRGIAALVDISF